MTGAFFIFLGLLAVLLICDHLDERRDHPHHLDPLTPVRDLDRAALRESWEEEGR